MTDRGAHERERWEEGEPPEQAAGPAPEAEKGIEGDDRPAEEVRGEPDEAAEERLPGEEAGFGQGPDSAPPPDRGGDLGQATFIPRITIGGFAETDAVANVFDALARDRRVSRAVFERHEGGLSGALEAFREGPTPDLIVAESQLSGDALFEALEKLAALCPPGTRLILIGHQNDVALYRHLLKFGVGDYLVAPLEPLEIIDAITQLFQEGEGEALGKVTAFFGVRGGAGSSTVARNVAAAVAKGWDSTVLIADLDLPFGTVAFDLDLEPAQGVRDALEEGERVDETLIDRLIARRDERIGLLAAPASLQLDGEPDPEVVQLFIERARRLTPHLMLDLPHCWSGWVRKALHLVDEIVLVATPDLASLRNARNLAAAARAARNNDPDPRLVLNQVGMPRRREAETGDFKRVLNLDPIAQIPFDAGTFGEAAMRGELVAETRANSAAAEGFDRIARVLAGVPESRTEARPSVLARLLRRVL